MSVQKLRFSYMGSKFWLIFFIICFFPVALVLLATAARFEGAERSYRVKYEGSRFWLGFWTLACFPVAFVLMLLNGVCLISEDVVSLQAA